MHAPGVHALRQPYGAYRRGVRALECFGDGDHFAAVQFSGAGWGNLEGFGLWRVGPAGTSQRLLSSAFPPGEDWRIDGWPRSDCVAVSAVAERSGTNAQAPARRIRFGIETGEPIVIRQGDEACGGAVSQEPGDD